MIAIDTSRDLDVSLEELELPYNMDDEFHMLTDAWLEGLLSRDELIVAEKHLEKLGTPFLASRF